MSNKNYVIRTMSRAEVDIAVDWAQQEGWNPGLHDASNYYQTDPEGFLIGYLEDEPIATISVVKYDDSFAFLGFYIVKPEYRGQGYGIQIWNAGLQYVEGCNVALDGVVAQQDNYKKSGFKLAYRNIRYQGWGGGESPDLSEDIEFVQLSKVPFDLIDRYDRPFFPANRSSFTKAWVSQKNADVIGLMKSGVLAGYGVIRQCHEGYKIGPLFADDRGLAELLFLELKAKVSEHDPIFLDVPEVNEAAVSLAKKYDMSCSFETARMYTGAFPDLPFEKIFGVTSFEIG